MHKFGEKQENMCAQIQGIETQVQAMSVTMADQGRSLQFVHGEVADLKGAQQTITQGHAALQRDLLNLQNHARTEETLMEDMKDQLNKLERKSRRNNIRLVGVQETHEENCIEIVKSVLRDKFRMVHAEVENAHRTGPDRGPNGQKRPRHIIARMLRYSDKNRIMADKAQALAGESYFITGDQTTADKARKRAFQPLIEEAKATHKRWQFRGDHLIVDGTVYRNPPDQTGPPQVRNRPTWGDRQQPAVHRQAATVVRPKNQTAPAWQPPQQQGQPIWYQPTTPNANGTQASVQWQTPAAGNGVGTPLAAPQQPTASARGANVFVHQQNPLAGGEEGLPQQQHPATIGAPISAAHAAVPLLATQQETTEFTGTGQQKDGTQQQPHPASDEVQTPATAASLPSLAGQQHPPAFAGPGHQQNLPAGREDGPAQKQHPVHNGGTLPVLQSVPPRLSEPVDNKP